MIDALKKFLLDQANTPNQGKAHQMQQFLLEVERLEARAKLFESREYAALALETAIRQDGAADRTMLDRLAKAYYFNPIALFEDAAK